MEEKWDAGGKPDSTSSGQYVTERSTDCKGATPSSPPSNREIESSPSKEKERWEPQPQLRYVGNEPSSGFSSSVAVYSCHYECAEKEGDADTYIDYGDDEPGGNEDDGYDDTSVHFPPRKRQPSDGNAGTPASPPNHRQTNPPAQKAPPRRRPKDPPTKKDKKNKDSPKPEKRRKKSSKRKPPRSDDDGPHHLRNIFATPISDMNVESFKAPHFEKSNSEQSVIKKALEKNFMFSNLSEIQMNTLLNAFERTKYKYGQGNVITQGEIGDYFYVIRRGMLHYEVDGMIVGNASAGQTFGELALVYTSPRAASVIADSDCVLYRLDQTTFRYILQTHTIETEKEKRSLLEGIPFLKDLDDSYIDKLATAMVPRKFLRGESIARKGDEATAFYVIQEGKVRVKQLEIGGTTYEDHDLVSGSFFGESAILESAPREAHFVGKTDGFALSIDKVTFQEVLGDYEKLIAKSSDKKRLVSCCCCCWDCHCFCFKLV